MIPFSTARGLSPIPLSFACWLCVCASCGAAEPAKTATALAGSPKIDGEVDEAWTKAEALPVNVPVKALLGIPLDKAAQATARALWDEQKLYVLVEVVDATPSTVNGQPWERDSVEFFIDENNAKTRAYQKDDTQYRVDAKGQTSGGENYNPRYFVARAKPTADGYRVEAAITWRTIKGRDGGVIGFDIQVNDDPKTGSRAAVLKWCDPTDDSWADTSKLGVLKLSAADAK